MSNIVAFKPRHSAKDAIRTGDARGEILFFTGVRYIRDDTQDDLAMIEAYRDDLAAPDLMGDQDGERLKA